MRSSSADAIEVVIPAGSVALQGILTLPPGAGALVLFAHGTGSSRHSPRNQYVAAELNRCGMGTLLMDLLMPEEDQVQAIRFDVGLLAMRLAQATDWVTRQQGVPPRLGYFGASIGAAASIRAASQSPIPIHAIVSRGGRVDLAGADALARLLAPTMLIVGGLDVSVIERNGLAFAQLKCQKKLVIVPGASHLFEEPGALESVARLAAQWFERYLGKASP
ncbi:DeoR family transcriptional regulator [Cupriavidus sp. TA19]|uniref:dienelactone hydrolase family protein n=1 Tax=unclassified Cupriavidus TaxID=2640874 RepID=UPI000E2F1E5C|nr:MULTISPECIES: alpha/beta hydrolase [unclassified Cupriavidus]BDB26225.1 alpha/beta hydrolase [Cupriavidus sp. P-10]GLC93167.1 DeoR family transcriptional regulator [Cupriavidus sp. TA19]